MDLLIRRFLIIVLIILSAVLSSCRIHKQETQQPNVLLIICDDLNDFVQGMGGHPQASTPNIARLAAQGTIFLNAHSNDPVCAPSRASLFTGIYPHTSGLYSFENWMQNPRLANNRTIMEHLRENGYLVLGTGKLLHYNDTSIYDEFGNGTDYGPYAFNGEGKDGNFWTGLVAHPSVPQPFRSAGYVDGSFAPLSDIPVVPPDDNAPGYTGWWSGSGPFRYVNSRDRDLMPDEQNAEWAVRKIRELENRKDKRPFFLGVGFIRPHTPLHAPEEFFDMFPLDSVQLPVYYKNDLADCAPDLVNNNGYPKGPRHFKLLNESYPGQQGLKRYVQAYLACIAFVDAQIGIVLEALENSSFKDNTVVILTSDHGYHLGEKDQLFKHTLWEESTRIPLVIKVPGKDAKGLVCNHPVSLIDIYPTLIDLCGLPANTMKNERGLPLDGYSLKPFICGNGKWDGPDAALTAILSGNVKEGNNIPMQVKDQHFSIRTMDWRYTLTSKGDEELYHHVTDPGEWKNLAGESAYEGDKRELRGTLLRMTGRQEQ